MSVAVADNVQEEFSKPPPKKKWLQNYIEQDSEGDSLGNHIREETQEFVKLLGKKTTSNEGLRQWKAANTSQKLTLSQDVIGGVVQGVIDQFHNFFENDKEDPDKKDGDNDSGDKPEEQKLSQDDITPVVQSVISQFLNGSLSDSGFRRSRKRSHKHVNSRSKDRSGSSSFSSSATRVSSGRNSSVIQFNTSAASVLATNSTAIAPTLKPPIKVRKLETMINTSSTTTIKSPDTDYLSDNNEALNLSCPKNNTTKVTFANEDRCYSIDSVKSFQESKSMKMFSIDYSRRIHENLQLIVNADVDDDVPLDLADKSKKTISPNFTPSFKEHMTPVIHFRGSPKIQAGPKEPSPRPSTITPPIISVKPGKSKEFSSLPVSRQNSPISGVRLDNSSAFFPPILNKNMCDTTTTADPEIFATKDATIPFAVIKPKPIKPSVDAKLKLSSNQILPNFYASKHGGHSIFSFSDSFKPSSKATPEIPPPVKEPETLPGGSRPSMREVHNRLEKNRRAHLKSCFNELASECDLDPNKASNLLVIRSAYKTIMALRREGREQERNLANLVQEKIKRQNRLNELKREVAGFNMDSDSE